MTERQSKDTEFVPEANHSGLRIPVILFVFLFVAILFIPAVGTRYYVHGDVNVIHAILCLFFSINLLICFWEICLLAQQELIEVRRVFWRQRRHETGRNPAYEFFFSRVPINRCFTTKLWADVWATYSQYDASYSDKRTFGFYADIGNGFITPIPTMLLHVAFTVIFLPAVIAGIIGLMVFWQLTYVTSLYWVSFFLAERQDGVSQLELVIYIFTINSIWVLCGLLGLYVSVHLVLENNYSVLGY